MLGRVLQLKTRALLICFLWLKKYLKNFKINLLLIYLEKCGLFFDFQYGFRSISSTVNLLTVVSNRIAKSFNKSGATSAVVIDIPKLLRGFGMLVFIN